VEDRRRPSDLGGLQDLLVLGHQVVEVLLDPHPGLVQARGADDEAAVVRLFDLGGDRLDLLTDLFVVDLAGDAAGVAARHQHRVAARQGQVGGEGRALFTDRVLGHLHQDVLAAPEHVGDLGAPPFVPGAVVLGRRHLAEGQEALFMGADVDEGRFERPLDVVHDTFVDVAFEG
jgi:hypothetical protein